MASLIQRYLARPLAPAQAVVSRARFRLRGSSLVRRVAMRRTFTLLLALGVAATVHSTLNGAAKAEASWGETVPLVVTTKSIDGGAALTAEALKLIEMPKALAPDNALSDVPVGRRARVPLVRGEILTTSKVAGPDAGTIASRLAAGTQAVTVSIRESPAPLTVGDLVDVYGLVPDRSGEVVTTARTAVVAHGAVVLARDDQTATLAVATEEVAATVEATSGDALRIVITG